MGAFEMNVTEEFERWFAALAASDAEQVAGALELVAEVGPALSPMRAGRALLWFDGCSEHGTAGPMRYSLLPYADLVLWRREALRCLESPAFQTRLAQVDTATAEQVLAAVERVKQGLRHARTLDRFEQYAARATDPEPWKRARLPPGVLQFGFDAPGTSLTLAALEREFIRAIRLVGLEHHELESTSGLRELTVRTLTPIARVIYGIDVAHKRVLVLLGERLDRTYYGDSVLFAERRWQRYFARGEATQESP